ncbi:MAG: sigma-70 family RNA polymerase sigma factor [Planctomycetes bacterium]|nr:sigma-70 family RNA polymerase sigma factor [Planctomycetota bacterium]
MSADPESRPPTAAVTALLERWRDGDRGALESVAPLLYRELRRIAGRRLGGGAGGESLQPTGLVHEAWIRLAQQQGGFRDRAHFFGAAALAMRSVLVDRARRLRAARHGGERRRVPLGDADPAAADPRDALLDGLALADAMDGLAAAAPDASTVATLRFLGGLSVEETAAALGVSVGKVKKDWALARAWLRRALTRGGVDDG